MVINHALLFFPEQSNIPTDPNTSLSLYGTVVSTEYSSMRSTNMEENRGEDSNIAPQSVIAGPDPPKYYNPLTWKLISQGAEARVWYVPSFVTGISAAICKERFPKAYRVPELDISITKSRTRAEVRSMVKCRKGGVLTPTILGVHLPPTNESRGSACIFMEYIHGCTVRQYLEKESLKIDSNDSSEDELGNNDSSSVEKEDVIEPKKARLEENNDATKVKLTKIDPHSLQIATEIGLLVAKMHNIQIVHGDLTTSNILLRNPPSDENGNWKPELVMIDFGLATSTTGSSGKGGGGGHEEKAVDLYVLERAFEATHPGSKQLVKEILRAYKGACKTSDSVLQRLSQVRLRGRKRECFG